MTKGTLTNWFLLENNYNNMGVVVALWKKKLHIKTKTQTKPLMEPPF
jgi:hypothetical protein